MSDNLMLTVLGAVGVGALLMSMKENNVQEDWNLPKLNMTATKIAQDGDCTQSLNFAVNPQLQQSVKQAAMLQQQGVPQSEIISTLSSQNMTVRNQQLQSISGDVNSTLSNRMMMKENYENSSPSLGSSAVTRNDYVSYPGFNQTIPLQSPSLDLGRNILYNPPSLNRMGITEAYQSRVEKPLSSVEHYTNVVEGFNDQPPQYSVEATGLPKSGFVANAKSFKEAMNKGNSKSDSGYIAESSILPLGSMESANGNNTMLYDRPMYSGTRTGGWRQGGRGDSDLIRGDLAVCVDPCQKGWFQSSLKPSDLRLGALQVIGGGGEQANTLAAFAKSSGQISAGANMANVMPQYTPMQAALLSVPTGGTVSTSSFA
jgi:Family of unknown function (DUF5850)